MHDVKLQLEIWKQKRNKNETKTEHVTSSQSVDGAKIMPTLRKQEEMHAKRRWNVNTKMQEC